MRVIPIAVTLLTGLSAASLAAPPRELTPAKAVPSGRWFVDTAAETEILQPEPHARATGCLAEQTGGQPHDWSGVALRGVYRVPGFAGPVAILQARCRLGNAGFETHTWLLDTATMAPFDLGGTTAHDDVIATNRGLLAVDYLNTVRRAPGRCRYLWLGRSGRSEGLAQLVAVGDPWEAPATGEGPLATCDPLRRRADPRRPARLR